MIKLTESIHYESYGEYELVILKIKYSTREMIIGDFYGDVEKVIISPDEQYCIMAGCGITVYLLKEPFEQCEYEKNTNQCKKWCRDGDDWVEDIILENSILFIHTETGKIEKIRLDELFKDQGELNNAYSVTSARPEYTPDVQSREIELPVYRTVWRCNDNF